MAHTCTTRAVSAFGQHCCACLLSWTWLGVLFSSCRLILPLTLRASWVVKFPSPEQLANKELGVPFVPAIKGKTQEYLELLALTLQNALLDNKEALGPYWHMLGRFVR